MENTDVDGVTGSSMWMSLSSGWSGAVMPVEAAAAMTKASEARQARLEEEEFRGEQRKWNVEDILTYRYEERKAWREGEAMRSARRRWREDDVKQRHLDNGRLLWLRCVEKNRREVEERSEHLRGVSGLAGIITNFMMTNPVEFALPKDILLPNSGVSVGLITSYAASTAIVSLFMTQALIRCIFIMGCILKIGKTFVEDDAEEEFIYNCQDFTSGQQHVLDGEGERDNLVVASGPPSPSGNVSAGTPAPRRTFERFWSSMMEDEWECTFVLFMLGVCFFLFTIVLMLWILFRFSLVVRIVVAVLVFMAFPVLLHSYFTWGTYLLQPVDLDRSAADCTATARDARGSVKTAGLPCAWHVRPSDVSCDAAHVELDVAEERLLETGAVDD